VAKTCGSHFILFLFFSSDSATISFFPPRASHLFFLLETHVVSKDCSISENPPHPSNSHTHDSLYSTVHRPSSCVFTSNPRVSTSENDAALFPDSPLFQPRRFLPYFLAMILFNAFSGILQTGNSCRVFLKSSSKGWSTIRFLPRMSRSFFKITVPNVLSVRS